MQILFKDNITRGGGGKLKLYTRKIVFCISTLVPAAAVLLLMFRNKSSYGMSRWEDIDIICIIETWFGKI